MPPAKPDKRRRFRRRTLRILVDYSAPEGLRCEYATTLGAGGMFIESEEPLPRDAVLKVRFRLPGGRTLHEVDARVAWSAAGDDTPGGVPGMGIAFTDAAASAALARELDALD